MVIFPLPCLKTQRVYSHYVPENLMYSPCFFQSSKPWLAGNSPIEFDDYIPHMFPRFESSATLPEGTSLKVGLSSFQWFCVVLFLLQKNKTFFTIQIPHSPIKKGERPNKNRPKSSPTSWQFLFKGDTWESTHSPHGSK